ncbi:MAG: sigma-70 family RNA polymerase sigma factor [Phycisphaerales bacterium]|nr:sigma-70 family RNA polymerase sigma factor [Phycisphaerales bacterium]
MRQSKWSTGTASGPLRFRHRDTVLAIDYANLLERAAEGDDQAWSQLVSELAPRVHALIVANARDHELAEELTQVVFCTIAQRINDYVEQGRFEAWVFRIAMNKLRDEMRRRGRQARPVGETGFPDTEDTGRADRPSHAPIEADRAGVLWEAVRGLSDQDQEILHLRHVSGLGFKEIAEVLETPVGTLLARHFRAVRRLRDQLGDVFPEYGFESEADEQ